MKRHVALLIETSSIYGRGLLEGVVRYMRMHDAWSVFLEECDLTKKPPSWLLNWRGDGILSRATTPEFAKAIDATGVPLVELTDRHHTRDQTRVRSNDAAIGRIASEHLLERGFTRFGFCGYSGEAWSERRQASFVQAVEDADCQCGVYISPWHGRGKRSWQREQEKLGKWIGSFPRPLGIMCGNDLRAQQVLDACANMQIAVPEEIAVVGADNDPVLCRLCSPPLSSVIPNAEAIGFRAAELLSQMMDGQVLADRDFQIDPLGIATRQSTDVVAISDPDIASALRYIREHASGGITVDEVVQNGIVSRSTLERQVRKYLGRTPQEEIRRVQVDKVKELLLTTDLAVDRIAILSGFEHPEYMHVVFKRVAGTTPGKFRQQTKPQISPDNIS